MADQPPKKKTIGALLGMKTYEVVARLPKGQGEILLATTRAFDGGQALAKIRSSGVLEGKNYARVKAREVKE